MPLGRFAVKDLIRVNPKINFSKLKLFPLKGVTHYPKDGDFTSEPIRESEKYDTKIFMRHAEGFIICREHKKKNCSICNKLNP